jgi:hypothetical protein
MRLRRLSRRPRRHRGEAVNARTAAQRMALGAVVWAAFVFAGAARALGYV